MPWAEGCTPVSSDAWLGLVRVGITADAVSQLPVVPTTAARCGMCSGEAAGTSRPSTSTTYTSTVETSAAPLRPTCAQPACSTRTAASSRTHRLIGCALYRVEGDAATALYQMGDVTARSRMVRG